MECWIIFEMYTPKLHVWWGIEFGKKFINLGYLFTTGWCFDDFGKKTSENLTRIQVRDDLARRRIKMNCKF
jgi:hypothetical protein